MNKTFTSLFAAAAMAICGFSYADAQSVNPATFENLQLSPESYWIGDTEDEDYTTGTFESGSFTFANCYFSDYGSWAFYGYANLTDTNYTGGYEMPQQMMNCVGGGYKSANYGVCYCDAFWGPAKITLTEAAEVKGVRITNTAWVLSSIKKGDGISGPFAKGDYLKVTFTGYDSDNNSKSVDFYLADFRSENAEEHYIVEDWQFCDLSTLGKVVRIEPSMTSTKVNDWGPTTPSYFAFDNLGADKDFTGNESGVEQIGEAEASVRIADGMAIVTADGDFTVTATAVNGISSTVHSANGQAAVALPASGVNIIRIATRDGVKTVKAIR